MRTYKCFYRTRSVIVEAETQYKAQVKAATIMNAKHTWDVAVVLADVPVSTSAF